MYFCNRLYFHVPAGESVAQKAARMAADRQTWPSPLQWLWEMGQMKATEGRGKGNGRRGGKEEGFSWKKVFGADDSLEVFCHEVEEEEVEEVRTGSHIVLDFIWCKCTQCSDHFFRIPFRFSLLLVVPLPFFHFLLFFLFVPFMTR